MTVFGKHVHNPWKDFPAADYENHMRHPNVQQLQTLNRIVREQSSSYASARVLYIGICTGNGLEHLPGNIVGLDINPDFLKICAERHPDMRDRLEVVQIDLNKDLWEGGKVDLIIANLALEYIDVGRFLEQCRLASHATTVTSVVFQENRGIGCVSSSDVESVKVFKGFHREIEEQDLAERFRCAGLKILNRRAYELPNGKIFVRLDARFE